MKNTTRKKRPEQPGAIELSVVMPCLNEAQTVGLCVRKARGFFRRHRIRGEVVVGDNGSTDGSRSIARRSGARVVDVPLRGYGAAAHQAARAARGTFVIMGDSDDTYDFSNLLPILQKLRQGFDLVMGNRFKGGIETGAMPWKNRFIGTPLLTLMGRLLFRWPVGDVNCGLRGFSASAFRAMDLRTNGMEYASEMVIRAVQNKLKIAEVPVTLGRGGRKHSPHLRPWRDGWRNLRIMLLLSPRWLFFYPGLAMALTGLGLGLWLLPGPRRVGSVVLDVHSLLYAGLMLLLGTQSLALSLFVRLVAVRKNLRPPSPLMNKVGRFMRMETGLAVGSLLTLIGLAVSLAAFFNWGRRSFGPLEVGRTLRLVIPAAMALILGAETILFSFFAGMLELGTRRPPAT